MGNKNRARTRAVRAEMATSGDSYTRTAARIADTTTPPPAPPASSTPAADQPGTDAVRDHIRTILQTHLADERDRQDRIAALEGDGYRIIGGGQEGGDTWRFYDWRTGKNLTLGEGDSDECDAVLERLDPDNRWVHIDRVDDDIPLSEIRTAGVPTSLGLAIEYWVGAPGTPSKEIAEFIGWSVEAVHAHLDH